MESRMLLLNQVDVQKDGMLVAVDELRTFRYGAAEGEHKVRISGITTRDFFYRTKYNRAKAVFQASEAMKNIGRRVQLQCMDQAAACIIKSPIFYPVVIVFYENEHGQKQLSTFTAKAFLSLFAINSALKKFDKELPDGMERKVSIHSVHDVGRAIIHHFKNLFGKGNENDNGEYVKLGKVFPKGKRKRKSSERGEQSGRKSGLRSGGHSDRAGRDELQQDGIYGRVPQEELQQDRVYESIPQGGLRHSDPAGRETREERRARKKAEKLEKKREAARRKYEKLMGMDVDGTSMNDYGDSDDGDDEDILRELTGMSREEFETAEEAYDYNNGDYDAYAYSDNGAYYDNSDYNAGSTDYNTYDNGAGNMDYNAYDYSDNGTDQDYDNGYYGTYQADEHNMY